jgi:Protein of unknown function (DUF5818)
VFVETQVGNAARVIDTVTNKYWRNEMRYLLLSIVLLCAGWVVAQESAAQTNSPASGQTSSTNSGETTVQGCLSGSNGNYMLTDKNGTSYKLTGETAKLSEHVGHEIRVTGTAESATDAGAMGSESNKASHVLSVISMKHISKTCENGGGMSH